MGDSIDRVFAHALNTVKRIGSNLSRPPIQDRLLLYGLYKQATEGNVLGVLERPDSTDPAAQAKWHQPLVSFANSRDSWHSQEGISKTEAKRRYITLLIENMTKYAKATPEARQLIEELEFVWFGFMGYMLTNRDQVKHVPSSPVESHAGNSSPTPSQPSFLFSSALSAVPARTMDPNMSSGISDLTTALWKKDVERALERLNTEVAALREIMHTRNKSSSRAKGVIRGLFGIVWSFFMVVSPLSDVKLKFLFKHALVDAFVLLCIWAYMWRKGNFRALLLARVFEDALKRYIGQARYRLRQTSRSLHTKRSNSVYSH